MSNWTRADRVVAFVRFARRPVSLVDVAAGTNDDVWSISGTLSTLFYNDELNRTREPDERGRLRYVYTDPAYDELLQAREALRHIRRIARQGDVNIQPLLTPILDLVRTVLP